MKIVDLLTEHALQLRLQTPTAEARLNHEVSGSAATELIDPTPFLPVNALVVLSGIAMNFQDERAWDAYVERLANVPISAIAFSTGLAHRVLPKELVAACIRHDVPLLEVPSAVPPLQLDRHVEDVLSAERVALSDEGWKLADECARLANDGADLVTLLANIHRVVQAPLAIYDGFGTVLAQFPEIVSWPSGIKKKPALGVTRIPLPMGHNDPCFMEVKELDARLSATTVLGPASTIVALQLNRSVQVDADRHHEIRQFVDHCFAWDDSSQGDIRNAFKGLGLDDKKGTIVLLADMSGGFASTSWQFRILLKEMFGEVRVTEIGPLMFSLAQDPKEKFDVIAQKLLSLDQRQPLLLTQPLGSSDQLRLSVVDLFTLLPSVKTPQLARELSLSALVSITAGRGGREAAERFLLPLKTLDSSKSKMLFQTLSVFLANNGQASKTCEKLFIHRNSLNYRLRKIELLLNVDLSTLEGLSTCLLAIQLTSTEG